MAKNEDWIQEEFRWCDLPDERLLFRLKQIVRDIAAKPSASLPQACQDKAALKATYRFLDNDAVTSERILGGHQQATIERLSSYPVVLAVQDTTFIDYTNHPETEGLGPLATRHQRGLCVHTTLALTPEKVPLGILAQQVWVRDAETFAKLQNHKTRPIEEKESQKWLTSLEEVNEVALSCPTTPFVSVADREADVYDFLIAPRCANVNLLIRACQNRRLCPSGHLLQSLEGTPPVDTLLLDLPRRAKQPARQVLLSVRFATMTLSAPKSRRADSLAPVRVGAILAKEEHPPPGVEAVEWLLLTTLPLSTREEAVEYVHWYSVRWQIEVWHKVLKSGCRIESRQLGTAERLERCLCLYSIIAWRLLYLLMFSRHVPEAACTVLLEQAEWEALYCHVHKRRGVPSVAPSLSQAVFWIAQLGGYLGRKGDGPPGVTVLWRGLQSLQDITQMYRIMRPPIVGKG